MRKPYDEMVVTIGSLVEAAQRINTFLDGWEFTLIELDDVGNEIKNHGPMSLKECRANLRRGIITIIPHAKPAHTLRIDKHTDHAILRFFPDQLEITDADNRKFEYHRVATVL